MSTHTGNTTTTATTSTTTPAPARRPIPARSRPAGIGVARQVKQQRRGYAAAVLRTLARTHRGRPATQIRATLRGSLAPLGVRLTPATLRELAADIAAGRPVEPRTTRPTLRRPSASQSTTPDQGIRGFAL